ncbi:nicotinate-nucleotide adenylyltransferase [Sinanaerobacter sp. ZZT-01]|uniref:nicotinate-nucleotide adenylyltransferase n=1 Tax=Sinanaerobacter sp. ZZT-01 TaxID=3111540 RepID=UPI002D78C7EC|nr:nicotinate-nucleotide adenylyltransferase [Sinanaerobacter sp. ZZT-01]WRR93152.1 nicotinate-nucleotide adenylyltransferase [Sinanaerobacter sp. ZZT-01]
MNKIGIFGGSFDPIHYGHLLLAEQARCTFDLSRVIFVPAKISPFKLNTVPTRGEDRYNMVREAIEENPYFFISDYELQKKTVSYTIETLQALKKEWGDQTELYFITGTDAFLSIMNWSHSKELLTEFSFLVGNRPGYQIEALEYVMTEVRSRYHTKVETVEMPQVDISSTDIKERLYYGKSIKYLLPDSVAEYALAHQLYSRK